jgi:hypothetical protein
MSIRVSLDTVTTAGATGWAYSLNQRDNLRVQALLNHAVIGEAIADLYRADLAAAGLGDGNCGYNIEFYHEIEPAYLPFVQVKLDGGDVDLPRSTLSGYADFFEALYRHYPVTGRTRSVFGGLWIDRVDAAAMLRARRDLGMIAPAPADAVELLVRAGLALISVEARPTGGNGKRAQGDRQAGAAIERILQMQAVTDVLHVVLDDWPLVLFPSLAGGEEPEAFHQPSGMHALPSPAECLALVVPVGAAEVGLEVVRDSHMLPEFTMQGTSRWTSRTGTEALQLVEEHGLVDHYVLTPDTVAMIGPGLLYRITAPADAAVRAVVIPSRATPLTPRTKGVREQVCAGGARIWT